MNFKTYHASVKKAFDDLRTARAEAQAKYVVTVEGLDLDHEMKKQNAVARWQRASDEAEDEYLLRVDLLLQAYVEDKRKGERP